MDLHEEIAKMAYELYEKSGCIAGRDHENWVNAERIVLMRHASQDIEEPEGEEPMLLEEVIREEVEEKGPRLTAEKIKQKTAVKAVKKKTVSAKKKAVSAKEKDMPVKKKRTAPAKTVAAKTKKVRPAKAAPKSREKSP